MSTPAPPSRQDASGGHSIRSIEKVSTTMTFIEPWDQKAKGNPFYRSAAAPGMETVNFNWVDDQVTVSNARTVRDEFTLDRNGFAYVEDPGTLDSNLLEALRGAKEGAVERLYYPKVESLIMSITGASRVIVFDHTLRKRDPGRDSKDNTDGKEQPATTVHCDQSGKGSLRRLRQNLAAHEDYESILKGRVQMINVWRPLNGPVVDWPLAQMDYTTLDPKHVHPCDLWRGEYEERGQTVTIEHDPGQRWWYLGGHSTEEVTLLKIWDSWGHRGVADVCAHAAFKHPDTPADAAPRESVEVRCLALHEPGR
ncbi:Uu.00g118390.m01.CDS01 [Anthostomella pinea]|uniref:Uu.00g118390.m01.CDS01 n=1 Tax=Anthostomella pinea TaxID=933095 RepID=A0AAI8VGF7_9PEZI|nr:Uu.00g118390.m01.CDS01 [Anthostomella pinea]